ncbi:MAG: Hsp33 family molecular chaperone HslO [Methylotenera sp.]|nr:Hsp33 family molecular chaperone HslO [Oligoflexia bacterium]
MKSQPKTHPDRWIKCISTHGNIRGVAIQATELVKSVAKLHGLGPTGAKGMGEVIIGGLLIASNCKTGERINLNIQGSGFFRQALVDAHPDGTLRGYLTERPKDEVLTGSKNQEVGPWGSGLLSVLRTKGDEGKQPYIGTVPLLTGHLAKDLSFYWHQSEQIPSAVGLVVTMENGEVTSAGGFLVQALPGASQAEVNAIENHINDLKSFDEAFQKDGDPLHLLSQIFQSTAFIVVEEKPLVFSCNCSWERVERALILVGLQELKSMLAQDHQATVKCDFCTKEYKIDAEGLEKLILYVSGDRTTEPGKVTGSSE